MQTKPTLAGGGGAGREDAIVVPDVDCSPETFRRVVPESFPKLNEAATEQGEL